jgi:hypothetical protein
MACWADVVIVVDGSSGKRCCDVGNGAGIKAQSLGPDVGVGVDSVEFMLCIIESQNRIQHTHEQQPPCLEHTIETVHRFANQHPRQREPHALDDSDMAQVPDKVLSWLYSVLHVNTPNPPT